MKNVAFVGVLLAGAVGCNDSSDAVKGACNSSQQCTDGYGCVSGLCRRLCLDDAACTGGEACIAGVCQWPPAPSITSVRGNATDNPSAIANGLLVSGASLDHAAFSLESGTDSAALVVKEQSADAAHVLLPIETRAGAYALVASNAAGASTAEVTLTLPELTGDGLVERINTQATRPLSAAVMPPEFAALVTRVAALEARVISSSMTLNVGPSRAFKLPTEALASLRDKSILPGATVTIQLDDGTYALPAGTSLTVDHDNGDRIRIIGNAGDRTAVTLQFTDAHGVYVGHGKSLGYLNGLTVVGNENTAFHGVVAEFGSRIYCGTAVTVKLFGVGFYARGHSTISADGNADAFVRANENNEGFLAYEAGFIVANYAHAENNKARGFVASDSATIHAYNAVASGNVGAGFLSQSSSMLEAPSSRSTGNGTGYSAGLSSVAWVPSAVAQNSVNFGFYAATNSYIDASSSQASGNGSHDYYADIGSGTINATGVTGSATGEYNPAVNTDRIGGGYIFQ